MLMQFKYSHLLLILVSSILIMILGNKVIEHKKLAMWTEHSALEVIKLSKKAASKVNLEHVRCLAMNIYHEASGEPFIGQVAVARVVMNRIKHGFATNPCKVIYQTTTVPDLDSHSGLKKICQFSWVCENKVEPSKNNQLYRQAEDIATKILIENKWSEVLPHNVLFFHSNTVSPQWTYKRVMEIGNHIFYSNKKVEQN